MIRLVSWLLGRDPGAPTTSVREHDHQVAETTELDRQLDEATQQHAEAQAYRARAERIGPHIRRELATNHFGERMAAALEPRGYRS